MSLPPSGCSLYIKHSSLSLEPKSLFLRKLTSMRSFAKALTSSRELVVRCIHLHHDTSSRSDNCRRDWQRSQRPRIESRRCLLKTPKSLVYTLSSLSPNQHSRPLEAHFFHLDHRFSRHCRSQITLRVHISPRSEKLLNGLNLRTNFRTLRACSWIALAGLA